MRQEIMNPNPNPGATLKLSPNMRVIRSLWRRVVDIPDMPLGALHEIHIVPVGASTIVSLNPLDPGTVEDIAPSSRDDPGGAGWFRRPGAYGPVYR